MGEPINPEAWRWYYEEVGGSRCPIVDTWWQTETGGVMIVPLPIQGREGARGRETSGHTRRPQALPSRRFDEARLRDASLLRRAARRHQRAGRGEGGRVRGPPRYQGCRDAAETQPRRSRDAAELQPRSPSPPVLRRRRGRRPSATSSATTSGTSKPTSPSPASTSPASRHDEEVYRGHALPRPVLDVSAGDGCRRDEDGHYWITGRVDDVINVSGHRIGTAEVESAVVLNN